MMLKRLKILQLRLKTLLRLFEHYMNVDENLERLFIVLELV